MLKVYRDYSQEELDRQLNLRARWPEHADFFANWEARSKSCYEKLACHRDLQYGLGASHTLDLFLPPSSDGPVPLLLFIHGGYWQSLDKSIFAFIAPAFLEKGIAFATLNYTLAPGERISGMVAEIEAAFAYMESKSRDFGIASDEIVVVGHSAGGHLATMLGLTIGGDNAKPKAIASISGVYDLEPIRLSYHNQILQLDHGEAELQSPLNALKPSSMPFYLAVGGNETEEFIHQQQTFAKAAQTQSLNIKADVLEGLNHFSIVEPLAEADTPLFREVSSLFD